MEPDRYLVAGHSINCLGKDRQKELDQTGLDQPRQRARGTAEPCPEQRALDIQAHQSLFEHLPDPAKRLLRGNSCLEADLAEQ